MNTHQTNKINDISITSTVVTSRRVTPEVMEMAGQHHLQHLLSSLPWVLPHQEMELPPDRRQGQQK